MGVLTPPQAKRQSTKRALTDNCCPCQNFLEFRDDVRLWILAVKGLCGDWVPPKPLNPKPYLGFALGLQVLDLVTHEIRRKPCGHFCKCRPMINKPPPLNRDYNRDPNIKALKRGGVIIPGLHYWFEPGFVLRRCGPRLPSN